MKSIQHCCVTTSSRNCGHYVEYHVDIKDDNNNTQSDTSNGLSDIRTSEKDSDINILNVDELISMLFVSVFLFFHCGF